MLKYVALTEEESLYRLLAALGGLVSSADGAVASSAVACAKDLELPSALASLQLPATASPRLTQCRDRCLALLK